MSNTVIRIKHSTETGNVPSGLVNGEIAINTFDGKLFYRDPSGSTQSIQNFPGPAGLDGEIQFNDSGDLGSSANLTFNKTTGNLSSRSVHTRSYIEFSDGTRQFTANAGGGGGTVLSVAGATGAVSNTQLLEGIKTVDGAGSGLDADLLDGVSSASFLRSDVYDTFTSLQSTTGINDLTVGGYTNTYNVRASYSESFASQPMATEMWHDLFAFTKHYTTTFETSNGSVWTAATLDRDLFAQKENQSKLIINGTTVVAARWTFTNTAFGSARWLVIGHAWSTPDPNKTILVQSSADGVTWSTKHTSTYSFVAASMFHRLDEYYGDAYLRVTITWNSGGTINLSNIKLLTSRPGDQGRGKESQYPYSWDGNQNITTGNNLYVISTANTVWHAGNDGSGSGLDADLLDGNEASVFMRKTADSNFNMNNLNITNVNNIDFNDPGVNEGLSWSGGNLWRIYESPNNLTNASGNLQIVQDTTRRATFNTSGQLELPIATGTSPLLISSNTVVANLNADLWDGNEFASYLNQAVLTTSSPTFANLNVSANIIFSGNTTNGRIGIGTSSPNSLIHVSGNTFGDNGTYNGSNSIVYIKQINTWSGNQPWALFVEGYSYLNGFRINAGDGQRALFKAQSGGVFGFASIDASPITFTQNNSTERMRIDSSGFVGISTTSPGANLSVAGTFGISESGSSGNRLRFSTSASGAIINQNDNSPIILQTSGNTQFQIAHTANAVNYVQVTGAATGGRVSLRPEGNDTNIGLTLSSKGTGSIDLRTSSLGTNQLVVLHTASAVNYVTTTGAIASSSPRISVDGTDTNIDLNLTTKGTGAVNLNTGGGTQVKVLDVVSADNPWLITGGRAGVQGARIAGLSPSFQATDGASMSFRTNAGTSGGSGIIQFLVAHTANAVNYVQVTGAATGARPVISAQGSNTNIDLELTPKGNGSVLINSNMSVTGNVGIGTTNAIYKLEVSGNSGQLFSVTDSLTGTIFSVNDISGIPSIEVIDTGLIKLGEYSGNIVIGSNTDNSLDKLQVTGNVSVNGVIKTTSTTLVANLNADLLDSYHASDFPRKTENAYVTGDWTFEETIKFNGPTATSDTIASAWFNSSQGAVLFDNQGHKRISWNDGGGNFNIRTGNYYSGNNTIYSKDSADVNGGATHILMSSDFGVPGSIAFYVAPIGNVGSVVTWTNNLVLDTTFSSAGNGGLKYNGVQIWHADNDGSGSTLDADLLDGLQGSSYANSTFAQAAYNHANTRYSSSGGTISGDVQISGNLIVVGNTVTHSANDFIVNDPIILIANNNPGNIIDVGFVAHYQDGGANTKHTGLIRDVSTNTWYLFEGYEPHVQETNILNIAHPTLVTSNLRANLFGNANTATDSDTLDGVHASGFIRDFGVSVEANLNSIPVNSGKYRWNNTSLGRPAESQTNEYGTLLNLNYDGILATQLAHDIFEENLYLRTLNVSSDIATTWRKFWHDGNDGSGSGLDADLLDGFNTSTGNTVSTVVVRDSSADITTNRFLSTNNGQSENFRIGDDAWIGDMNASNTIRIKGIQDAANAYIVFGTGNSTALGRAGTGALTYGGSTVWHAGNDGSGSGLDADTVDGIEGSAIVTTTTITNYSINPRFSTSIGFGNDTEVLYFNDATNQTRSIYWTNKDGFEIRGDSNSKDAVVLQTGNLELTQNAYVTGIIGTSRLLVSGTQSTQLSDSSGSATSIKMLQVLNGSYEISFGARMGAGSYNGLTQSNDSVLVFNSPNIGNGSFSIVPWASATSGIRISSENNVANVTIAASNTTITGNLTINTDTLFVDSINDRVGIKTFTSPITRLQVGRKVIDDNNYGHDSNSLYIIHQANTSTSVLNDPKEVLVLARQGTNGQSYGSAASFKLSRYESNSTNSRTRMDIDLAHNAFLSSPTTVITLRSDGNVGIGNTNPSYKLQVNGSFAATTKSFVIPHPTKKGKQLRYGSLEGPENGVYIRGTTTERIIKLPDYWKKLVREDSITVNLTPVGSYQQLYVEKIEKNKIYIKNHLSKEINCHFTIFAERADVEKLEVEI